MSTRAAEPTMSSGKPDILHRGLRLTLGLCLIGFLLGFLLLQIEDEVFRDARPLATMALFRGQDTYWLGFSALAGLLLLLYPGQLGLDGLTTRIAAFWTNRASPRLVTGLLAVAAFGVAGLGTYLIHDGRGFVFDEFMGEIQARIFLSGQILAHHPDEWTEFTRALFPYFLLNNAEHQLWGSGYRPVFAAIRALFEFVSIGPLTNAFLTASSVVLVASIAQKLWPERRDAAVLAAVLLATCPQLLFTGMTGYAWPAHLCLNLLWLRLFLRDDRLGHGLAALVGFAAVGLHQINPHPTFVLPFMISLLLARRWSLAGFYASTYTAALAVWIFWPDIAVHLSANEIATAAPAALAAPTAGVHYVTHGLALISAERVYELPLIAINLFRLIAWQNLAVLPLILVALRPWSGVPPTVRLLAWSCVLTIIPYVLIMPNQMHGWGYRYLHGLLGNMALIATFGWISLSAQGDLIRGHARQMIAGLTALVVLVGLPLRTVQVERFVAPMATADRYLHAFQSDLVLVDTSRLWYEDKVIRNDPLLSDRPLIMTIRHLTADQIHRLCSRYTVTFVASEDLVALGVPGARPSPPPSAPASDASPGAADLPRNEHSCPAS